MIPPHRDDNHDERRDTPELDARDMENQLVSAIARFPYRPHPMPRNLLLDSLQGIEVPVAITVES